MEKYGVLRDHGYLASQRLLRDILDILAIDIYMTAIDIEEAEDEIDKSTFPTTRKPYKAHVLAGLYRYGIIGEEALALFISEINFVENDLPFCDL